jgi:iron complex transport system substrate-binding protein
MRSILFLLICFCLSLTACNNNTEQAKETTGQNSDSMRIVSLSGTTTEILSALGMEQKIVGVDVTSTYPASIQKLPKVGHNRNMSAEAIIALDPSLVVGITENTKPELVQQLRSANIKVQLYDLQSTPEGAKNLVRSVADSMGVTAKAEPICQKIDEDLKGQVTVAKQPKVLFIYARGAGTMMVAGDHTYPNAMIGLSGGKNAVTGFEDFKPLTPEALVAANPDVILMFDSGLQSLGGADGLMQIPGMAQTNAGKNKQVIEMDGQFLTGFGPRTGEAIATLSKKLNEVRIP